MLSTIVCYLPGGAHRHRPVDELERAGCVERTTDPADRRAKLIRLTERGRQGQAAATRILRDIEQWWAQHLGPDRVTALRRTLEEIISLQSRW